jgi:hypothetical protein
MRIAAQEILRVVIGMHIDWIASVDVGEVGEGAAIHTFVKVDRACVQICRAAAVGNSGKVEIVESLIGPATGLVTATGDGRIGYVLPRWRSAAACSYPDSFIVAIAIHKPGKQFARRRIHGQLAAIHCTTEAGGSRTLCQSDVSQVRLIREPAPTRAAVSGFVKTVETHSGVKEVGCGIEDHIGDRARSCAVPHGRERPTCSAIRRKIYADLIARIGALDLCRVGDSRDHQQGIVRVKSDLGNAQPVK